MQSKKNNKPAVSAKETRLKVTEPVELMTFILSKMGGMSRNSVKALLSHRLVTVNNKVTTPFNTPLKPGDSVIISSSKGNTVLTHPKLRIIHEDNSLIVVFKKEGLLTVSTGKTDETTAFSILKNYVKKASPQNRIYVVHRIDRETSGIIIFAKNKETQLTLQENWHRIILRRIYVAVVEGKPEKDKDTIKSWLTENEKSLKIHSSNIDNGGQLAITHYKVLKSNGHFSLLELELETGRKNQIRVHLQGIGHPIAGDEKYSSEYNPIGRMALHARLIEFIHPESGKKVCFETPVPAEFLKAVKPLQTEKNK